MAIGGVTVHPHDYYVRAGAWVRSPFPSLLTYTSTAASRLLLC